MSGGITIHALRAESVRRADLAPLFERFPERMARSERFRRENDRLLCVGAGILLREALGLRDESELRCGEDGKPFAPGYPAFSLSHGGDWCVLAIGEGELGVDIERIDEKHLAIAPEACTREELAWLRGDAARFCTLWTLKESMMKATGLGMKLEPRRIDVLPFTEGKPVSLQGTLWHAWSGGPEGHRCAVCASRPITAVRWAER